ncbi:IQ calmodulin-binding motif-containing protein [Nitzschia inconspicua]|uniref:IQ calmodulin-binding motif-containing protein n=1 Tax=Nitzschia inconspicua TaxID=303405 RepID=A0A9K3KW29_9STRA|nr:IQ calmodulin-binding motif-containing protein [Nitzschia inconspicua]
MEDSHPHRNSSTDAPATSFFVSDNETRPLSTSIARKSQHSSSVLANKFNSLDERWTDHKAKSPIKIVRARRVRNQIASSSDDASRKDVPSAAAAYHRPAPSPGLPRWDGQSLKNQTHHRTENPSSLAENRDRDDDTISVGASTISTLSSAESVFDRLYRQGIQSPKHRRSSASACSHTRNHLGRETQSLVSPSSTHNRRVKNRLEAYETRSLTGVAAESKTPRRSGPVRHLTFADGVSNDGDSVYDRLYRNQKRSQKLWTAPPRFTPKLSSQNRASRHDRPGSVSHHVASSTTDLNTARIDDSMHIEEPAEPVLSNNLLIPTSTKLDDIDTTLEEDLEAIKELGKQLGGQLLDDCSPTVAATSVSTTDEPMIPLLGFWQSTEMESPDLDRFLASNYDSVDEDLSFLGYGRQHFEKLEQDQYSAVQRNAILSSNSPDNRHDRFSLNHFRNPHDLQSTQNRTSGFFTLDSSFSRSFLAERIDRLSSPIYRRRKEWMTEGRKCSKTDDSHLDVEPLLTPQRLREASAVTIQCSWRVHTAELRFAGFMITTWKTDFRQRRLGSINTTKPNYGTRTRVLEKAIRKVRCWWILEGVVIEGDAVSISWENEVMERKLPVQVSFECGAILYDCLATRWCRRKIAMLLVKSGLKRALRGEQCAFQVQRWYRQRRGYLTKTATKLQRWAKHCLEMTRDTSIRVHLHPPFQEEDCYGDAESKPVFSLKSRAGGDTEFVDEIPDNPNEREDESKGSVSKLEDSYSPIEHEAAIAIQSWLRISMLRNAAKGWPSSRHQLQAALTTAGCSQQDLKSTFDEFDAARMVLYSTAVARRLGGGTNFPWLASDSLSHGFVSKRAAALAIQNIVRAYISGLKKFRDKQRATLLQSVFRGYLVRKKLESAHLAAVVIQFAWTNHRYTQIKIKHAIRIQKFWRKRYCERNFCMLRFCIVYLQANWRRALVRRTLSARQLAALSIQKVWRGYRTKIRFLALKSAASTLQLCFRHKAVIAIYKAHCKKAVKIQTIWRAHRGRQVFERIKGAATRIQCWFRTRSEIRRYNYTRRSVAAIQCSWRLFSFHRSLIAANMEGSAVRIQSLWRGMLPRSAFFQKKGSAVAMQKIIRGYTARRRLRIARTAISSLSSIFRMRKARKAYLLLVSSVIQIQSFSRMKSCQKIYRHHLQDIVTIQRLSRGRIVRISMERQRWTKATQCATLIQRSWRASFARDVYFRSRMSAVVIQSALRRLLARRKLQLLETERLVRAATKIQGMFRGNRCRWHLKKISASATTIQSLYRGIIVRRFWLICDEAARVIQVFWRTHQSRSAVKAAIIIQSHWRSSQVRIKIFERRIAAISIQSHLPGLWVRRRRNEDYHKRRTSLAALSIQSFTRMLALRLYYKRQRHAAIKIQSILRYATSRKMVSCWHLSATRIAAYWRAAVIRQNLNESRVKSQMVTVIQRRWRHYITPSRFQAARSDRLLLPSATHPKTPTRIISEKRRFHEKDDRAKQSAALELQRVYRGFVSRRKVYILQNQMTAIAANTIQRQWRASVARERILLIRVSLLLIQSHARGFIARKALSRSKKLHRSAIILQSFFRGIVSRSIFLASVAKLQYWWREESAHRSYIRKELAAATIQLWFKKQLARCRAKAVDSRRVMSTVAAVTIQKQWRAAVARDRFLLVRGSLLLIQSHARGFIARNELSRSKKLHRSAIILQSFFRGIVSRSIFLRQLASAAKLQYWWREETAHRNYIRKELAAATIQLWFKKQLARCRAKAIDLRRVMSTVAAVTIQKQWRAAVARDRFLLVRGSLLLIQSHARGFIARNALSRSKKLYRSAIILQSFFRGIVSRSIFLRQLASAAKLQYWWREETAHRNYIRKELAAATIQLWFRKRLAVSQAREFILRKTRQAKENCSAVTIQTHWRRSRMQNFYSSCRIAAIIIQAAVRGVQVRETWWFIRFIVERKTVFFGSASKIQIFYAVWKSELAVWEMKSLAVLLRRGMRGQLERSVVRYALFHVNSLKHGTLPVSLFRLAEKQKQGALAVARWHRAVGLVSASAAVVIQSIARGFITRKEVRSNFGITFEKRHHSTNQSKKHHGAARIIQLAYRHLLQRRLLSSLLSENNFQRHVEYNPMDEMMLQSEFFAVCATTIQSYYRRLVEQSCYRSQRMAGIRIQRSWRRYHAAKYWIDLHRAVISLQFWFRNLQQQRKAAIVVQKVWRSFLARQFFQQRIRLEKQLVERSVAEILSRTSLRCDLLVEKLLAGAEVASGPCIDNLVSRVNAALIESTLSNGFVSSDPICHWESPIVLPTSDHQAFLLEAPQQATISIKNFRSSNTERKRQPQHEQT